MRVTQYKIEGLGHLSTLIADEAAGVAAVVDPRRDVDIYLEAARADGLRISHVIETHLHNDYVSGGRELAALTGATHVIGAGAELGHEHRPVRNGETVEVGTLRFRALDTPGHTPEHVSYAVADTSRADEPFLLLTGGSLLVGAVGRTDLLGADRARAYAGDMYHSLHDVLLPHEESVMVYPTHGAGSLCSTGISSTSWSTIGYERRHDPLLQPMEIDAFARALLGGPADRPALLRPDATDEPGRAAVARRGRARDRPVVGRRVGRGPRPRGADRRRALAAPPCARAHPRLAVDPGGLVVRDVARLGGRAGPADRPPGRGPSPSRRPGPPGVADRVRAVRRLRRRWLRGVVPCRAPGRGRDGPHGRRRWPALLAAGGPEAPFVIDVRQPSEYEAGHVPGSTHIGAGELPEKLDRLPRDRPIATICASGYRSSVAASMLRAAGFEDVAPVANGLPTWEAHGFPVEYGPEAGSADWPAATAAAGEAHTH